jgi:thiol-disulfide isomerase/thioredoxin
MIRQTGLLCTIVAVAMSAIPATALDLGDPPPALTVDWLSGGPYTLKDGKGKNVFVLHFWATWCGPCRKSLPELTALQHKYKDKGLVVIGINVGNESESTVKKFLKDIGDKVDFSVALDKREATAGVYMLPLGVQGIPFSCVIDRDGVLAWYGSPFEGLNNVVDKCVAGTYNFKVRRTLTDYFKTVLEADRSDKPDDKTKLARKAREIGDNLLKAAAQNPDILDILAWNIVTLPVIKTRDFDLAHKAAKAAFDATKGQDPSIIDTYARVLWETGNKPEALRQQRAAIELVKDQLLANVLKDHLKEYEEELQKNPPTSAPASQATG